MKKFLYILSVLTAILLFDSCTKEEVVTCENNQDPFAQEHFDEDTETRGRLDETGGSGGVIDDEDGDDEMDEDTDAIVDDEDNDDEMDEDDDELIDDRSGEGNDED